MNSVNVPKCLPFETLQNLLDFENASDEEYSDVVRISLLCKEHYCSKYYSLLLYMFFQVNYLAYLGGLNASDAAAFYFKKAFKPTTDLCENVTWQG